MKAIFALSLALVSTLALGYVSGGDAHRLDRMSRTPAVTRLGTELYQAQQFGAKGQYDFSVQGGAIGDIALQDVGGGHLKLPDNAIVVDCFYDVVTAMATSGGTGTIAVKVESAADLVSVVDADTVSDQVACDGPDGAEANMVKLTADRTVYVTVASEALTAGKFNLYLQYVLSN